MMAGKIPEAYHVNIMMFFWVASPLSLFVLWEMIFWNAKEQWRLTFLCESGLLLLKSS